MSSYIINPGQTIRSQRYVSWNGINQRGGDVSPKDSIPVEPQFECNLVCHTGRSSARKIARYLIRVLKLQLAFDILSVLQICLE